MQPFCFVLMPFGRKPDNTGRTIDFDAIYASIIKPAIEDAQLEPIRADEEAVGGIIHRPMFERLMLCDYAVADLTTANPNVFYELGVRHGIRPHSTVLMFAGGTRLPFDVALLRGLPYEIDSSGAPTNVEKARAALATRLNESKTPNEDSPLFQLVADWPRPDLGPARLKTDIFRERVEYSKRYKEKLARARTAGAEAVAAIERELTVRDADPAIVIDLFLSYRAVSNWDAMVALVDRMPQLVASTPLVQEQLGFALNRLGRRDEAERVLSRLIETRGPSSETNGLLGRVYKDRWQDAVNQGRTAAATGFLRKAIETYLAGFETDWRDAFPGVNAVILMELTDPVDPRQSEVVPVVRYAVKRRLAREKADYWDHATLLELHVLAADRRSADAALADALAAVREVWEPETTARNLRLIKEARAKRGVDVAWIDAIEREFVEASKARS